MMKPVILLDIDDTLADFNGELWKLHNDLYNTNVSPEDIVEWDLSKFSILGSDVYNLFKYPNLYRNLPLKPYAKELVENLSKDFEVCLVTDSPKGVTNSEAESKDIPFSNPTDDKKLWIAENFPNIPKENIFFTSSKHLIMGDIIIDDKPETIERFMKDNRNHILIDMPYNAAINTPYRAKDLKTVEKMVYDILDPE